MKTISQHSAYGGAHQVPKMIVVHAMGEYIMTDDGGGYVHAVDFLERQGLSAHALVTPTGEIIRLRTDEEGAYHAKGFNTDTLGIEVLVAGNHNYSTFLRAIDRPYIKAMQYVALVEQCREWVVKYGITRIVRHSDLSPGRKVDPGAGFPWAKFLDDVMREAA